MKKETTAPPSPFHPTCSFLSLSSRKKKGKKLSNNSGEKQKLQQTIRVSSIPYSNSRVFLTPVLAHSREKRQYKSVKNCAHIHARAREMTRASSQPWNAKTSDTHCEATTTLSFSFSCLFWQHKWIEGRGEGKKHKTKHKKSITTHKRVSEWVEVTPPRPPPKHLSSRKSKKKVSEKKKKRYGKKKRKPKTRRRSLLSRLLALPALLS